MSKHRIKAKPPVPAIVSREEMESLVGDIARLKTFQQQTTALMDQRITEIRAGYESQLTDAEETIGSAMEAARVWAEANPEAFGKLKSLELLHGVVGWRTATPSLKPISGWTWDRVLEKLRSVTAYSGFVRVKTEVDKQAILAQREHLLDGDLRAMGVRVVQEDTFFVEPKLTEVVTKITA